MLINILAVTSLEKERATVIFSTALVFGFFVLPGPAYVAMLTLCIAIFPSMKSHSVAFVTIFYFSFLIVSRYSGLVWGGSDDLPSYLLAYDAITSGERDAISASFFYAKHLDIGFIGLTKIINYLSSGNRFIYYFVLVSTSFSIYYWFLLRALKGSYALLALIMFFLFFKNIHLSMHILRSSLAIPMILLSLTFYSRKRYIIFLIASTFQASSAVLSVLTLITRDILRRVTFTKKIIVFSIVAIVFFILGNLYLFGKITHVVFSFGVGNYPIILSNIIIGVIVIIASNKKLIRKDDGLKWLYLYGYFIFVSLLSLFFSQHTYRFSHFILYMTPMIISFAISSSGKRFDYLLYVLVLFYLSGSYYTYYYILELNESSFYYRSSSDVLINGFSQLFLFFDYIELDIDYSSFWR